MSIVKTLAVGNGDMFYIQHGTNNFSIIDCCLDDINKKIIVDEILEKKKGKEITRFISTHPDEDHIRGLKYLDSRIGILNFYCVTNSATKEEETDDFKHYCELRDGEHHYYIFKGCKRKWMNDHDSTDPEDNGSSGIDCLWPITTNDYFQAAQEDAKDGLAYNNLSPIIKYSLNEGASILWMGDMEHDFLEYIKDEVRWPSIDVLFAPHHGRSSGKVSADVLKKLAPNLIIIGEAPSKDLDYYQDYNTITQNSAGDITFNCTEGYTHIYLSNSNYTYDTSFLEQRLEPNTNLGVYIGSLKTKEG